MTTTLIKSNEAGIIPASNLSELTTPQNYKMDIGATHGGLSSRTPAERARLVYQKNPKEMAQLIHPMNIELYGDPSEQFKNPSASDKAFLESIKDNGILEPIVMCKPTVPHYGLRKGGHRGQLEYVVSGHRRLAAALTLGLKKVPVRFFSEKETSELEIEKFLIESNRQRIKTEAQKDAEAAALLRIETELASVRETQGKHLPTVETGKAVEKVAEVTGESAETVRKRVAIHDAKIPAAERNGQSTNKTFHNLPKEMERQQARRRKGFVRVHPEHAGKTDAELDGLVQSTYRTPTVLRKHFQQPNFAGSPVEVPMAPPSAGEEASLDTKVERKDTWARTYRGKPLKSEEELFTLCKELIQAGYDALMKAGGNPSRLWSAKLMCEIAIKTKEQTGVAA